ncbi:MAG: hypothetical protein RIS44_3163 [Pseudomonadota bacterium]|jgi:hypothetical protein
MSEHLDHQEVRCDADQATEEAWDTEAARRDSEIESGASVPVDGKEVLAKLRAQIR